jgi:hypothetical protein
MKLSEFKECTQNYHYCNNNNKNNNNNNNNNDIFRVSPTFHNISALRYLSYVSSIQGGTFLDQLSYNQLLVKDPAAWGWLLITTAQWYSAGLRAG